MRLRFGRARETLVHLLLCHIDHTLESVHRRSSPPEVVLSFRQIGIVLQEMSCDTDGNNSFEMLPLVSEEGDRSIRRRRDAVPPAFGNKNKLYYFPICKQSPGAHVSVEESQELLAECSEHCCQYPFCNASGGVAVFLPSIFFPDAASSSSVFGRISGSSFVPKMRDALVLSVSDLEEGF